MTATAQSRQKHRHYDHYSAEMARRLDGFYGQIEHSLAKRIAPWVAGSKVLDVGCGFGSLVEDLRGRGLDAIGVDLLEDCIEIGRQRYPQADLRVVASEALPFPDKSFDTIILKDAIHHIFAEADLGRFLCDARRVCRERIVVMDPNPTLVLRVARRIIGHLDPVCAPAAAERALVTAGFHLIHREFHEVFAFPLSGGYVSVPLVPKAAIGNAVLGLDRLMLSLLRRLRLDRYVCWRYLLVGSIV